MDTQDHLNVDKGDDKMKKLSQNEMKQYYASGLNGTLLNAILRGANIFVDVGRCFGSAIRRITSRNMCR